MPRSTASASSTARLEMIEAILKRLAPTQTERHPQIAASIEQQIFMGGGAAGSRGKIKGVLLPSSVLQRAFVKATEQVRDGGKPEIQSLGSYLTTMLLNIARDSRAVDPRPALEERRQWARQLRQMLRDERDSLKASGRKSPGLEQVEQLLESRGMRGRAAEGERWIKAAERHLEIKAPKRAERREPDSIEHGRAWNETSDQGRYRCAALLRWVAREHGKQGAIAARRLEVLLGVCSLVTDLERIPKSTEVHRFVAKNTFVPHDPRDLLHKACTREKNCGGCRIVRLDLDWCKSVLQVLDDSSAEAPNFATLRDFERTPRGRLARDREATLDFLENHFQSKRVEDLRAGPVGSDDWSSAARELTALGRELCRSDAELAKR